MPNKMLIDASHPEETRVVVTHGNRIEEFDFESQDKKQIKGNIYLARVTRVEPSLQAAFIEYGGNRHGFLAFSEIHPDYYQIPIADRQALLRADAEAADEEDEDEDEERGKRRGKRRGGNRSREGEREPAVKAGASETAAAVQDEQDDLGQDDSGDAAEPAEDSTAEARSSDETGEDEDNGGDGGGRSMAATADGDVVSETYVPESDAERATEHDAGERGGSGELEEVGAAGNGEEDGEVESVGAEDALEELPSRRRVVRKHYKIQEVIKRRQILLVQVVKEERGNKGAAMTTYLSLAGRYSVLMPNTARGGGISRKITSIQDRKRLKDVVKDLDVPQGMGVILRTAGANRTKPEIKRDYEYLMRLWENVRTLTLQSTAPALVYEEGSLIKRSVRDLYNKDIDEILVSGEEGYREAKDFMRMLMPSHAKVVQPYRDIVPIFARNGIEAHLDRMLQPQVTLKSGGYIIINQTEALVAIDVNSGRSTREHSIEDTALQTNLEAAEEVARQLRLRDLAGLIVIDFIDMEENRNNRAVEKRIKDHLKNDRARIQVGRISHFGLLEMSRQRIRASVLESTTQTCQHCGGTGHVRSDSSVALHVIRAIEEFLLKDAKSHITVRTPTATALYVLNQKRRNLNDLEARFGLTVTIEADDTVGKQHHVILRGAAVEKPVVIAPVTAVPDAYDEDPEDAVAVEETEIEEVEAEEPTPVRAREERPRTGEDRNGGENGEGGRKRKRRRRRRGGRDRDGAEGSGAQSGVSGEGRSGEGFAGEGSGGEGFADEAEDGDDEDANAQATEGQAETDRGEADGEKKRRRGKRGGRRNRRDDAIATDTAVGAAEAGPDEGDAVQSDEPVAMSPMPDAAELAGTDEDAPAIADAPVAADVDVAAEAPPAKPKRAPRRTKAMIAAEAAAAEALASQSEGTPAAEALEAEAGDAPEAPAGVAPDVGAVEPAEKPRASRRRAEAETSAPADPVVVSTGAPAAEGEDKPKKGGWWQRRGFF